MNHLSSTTVMGSADIEHILKLFGLDLDAVRAALATARTECSDQGKSDGPIQPSAE